MNFIYEPTSEPEVPAIGLVVLRTDETIELDVRRTLSQAPADIFVTRVPSGDEVTNESLGEMEAHLKQAASLFPARPLAVIGYGCTSGSAVIGSDAVANMIRQGCDVAHVTNPLSALIARCRAEKLSRIALLSPYVETVSARLRTALAANGIETPVFGSFNEAREEAVARISSGSLRQAARDLCASADMDVDAIFLSCTNLRTLDVLPQISADLGIPALSSNQVLIDHMMELAGLELSASISRGSGR